MNFKRWQYHQKLNEWSDYVFGWLGFWFFAELAILGFIAACVLVIGPPILLLIYLLHLLGVK